MAGIKWLLSFETGIENIDNDHRGLIDTLGNIQAALDGGDMDRCRELYKTFFDQAQEHFLREEAFLESIDFRRLESHAALHDHLLDLVRDTLQSTKNETDTDVMASHLDDITYYLLEDVIKADAEFKSYSRELDIR